MRIKALITAIFLAINVLAATIKSGSLIIDDLDPRSSPFLDTFSSLKTTFPDVSNLSTPLQSTYNVPDSYITLYFTGPVVRKTTPQTDTIVAITQFLVEAYKIGEMRGSSAVIPPQGLIRAYRNIQLSIRRHPGEAVIVRIADLVDVLSGIIYYMSYIPQGFTECNVDVYHRFQNPAIPIALIASFAIDIVEESR